MKDPDLREFIRILDERGELARIKHEVSPILEITEITDRTVKMGGKALFFENVRGYDTPVLTNAFGTMERMKMALGYKRLEEIGEKLVSMLYPEIKSLSDGIKEIKKVGQIMSFFPKKVRDGSCKEVIMDNPDLTKFPILKCWPGDAGRFITFPVVFTRDPETGFMNAGVYRMQVYDGKTTGMHWHMHKHGALHYLKSEDRLDVAVAIGVHPAILYSATAPLPEGFNEMAFAGFIRGKRVRMVECETVDLEVPAHAEIVIEGYVKKDELRVEGPFGDHTGYYTPPEKFPVFHVTAITHRENPIYHSTVVGKPPQEDAFLGKATERIFLPFLKMMFPEIVDINFPVEGGFHNLCIVSIRKRYPGHAKKVMMGLWGIEGTMLTKIIAVVDDDVNVHNMGEVLWAILSRIDPDRDVLIIPSSPTDVLDHASGLPSLGSKMGIDATRKWKGEGYDREWPDEIEMDKEVKRRIDDMWGDLKNMLLK